MLEFKEDGLRIPSGHHFGTIRGLELHGGTGFHRAIRVENGARVALENVVINGFAVGVEVIGGHVSGPEVRDENEIPMDRSVSVDCGNRPGFSAGIWARENSSVLVPNSRAARCTFGFWVVSGSTLNADGSTAEDNASNGFRAERGSVMQLFQTAANRNGSGTNPAIDSRAGYLARDNATVTAEGWVGPGNGNDSFDIEVTNGSSFNVSVETGTPDCGRVRCDGTTIIQGCGLVSCE